MRSHPFLLIGLVASGCGYSSGTGLHERGVHSIALEVVGNETFRQRLEVELGAALARELPVSADLTLAEPGRADAVLQVIITNADERTLVSGLPAKAGAPAGQRSFVGEGAFEGRVSMRLVGRAGNLLLQRRILDRTEFRSAIGENLTSARLELVEDLARKIVLALGSDF